MENLIKALKLDIKQKTALAYEAQTQLNWFLDGYDQRVAATESPHQIVVLAQRLVKLNEISDEADCAVLVLDKIIKDKCPTSKALGFVITSLKGGTAWKIKLSQEVLRSMSVAAEHQFISDESNLK